MSRLGHRRAAQSASRDLPVSIGPEDIAELDHARDRVRDRTRADRRLDHEPHARRLSQANRGLRMILVAAVIVVLISWGGALGGQYLRLMQIETLVAADQDVLRVMCAVEPPSERALGWMHICETAAGVGARGDGAKK